MKGPGLFSDIGKNARDLLNRDYNFDQKLSISTASASGLSLTSTSVKKGRFHLLDIGSQYKYKNTLIDVKIDSESNVTTTFTISEILPSTKCIVSSKLPNYSSGKVEMQYFHHHACLDAFIGGIKNTPVVELSGTVGVHGVALGAEGAFDTASNSFTKCTAGIGLSKPHYNASFIIADKGDTVKASCVYHFDEMKTSAVVEITRKLSKNENTVIIGGSHVLDHHTSTKARLDSTGKFATLVQHEIKPKSFLTISGEFDTKALDVAPKFGLALALRP